MTALVGAYHRSGRPLEQRGLVVEVSRRGFRLVGVVTAEGLADHARAEARVEVRRPDVEYRFMFVGDDGHRYVLTFTQTLRRLTELSGTLSHEDGTVVGSARLRLDWRRALGS